MKLGIPQEQPHRLEDDERASKHADELGIRRSPPDSPILHRLKALEQRAANRITTRPQATRKHAEQSRDVPHQRRRPVVSPDPRRPARTASNVVGVPLRPEEKQLLREAGRFRVVRAVDLRETLYHGKTRLLENDLRYLRDKGLVETRYVNLRRDGQRRTIERAEVITLTKDGRHLLLKQGDLPKDQRIYVGLVKPREAEHDSQIYRAYQKESQRIEDKGGSNLRVKLDFEIKADVQKAIYAAHKADQQRDMAEIKEAVAERFELPFIDGKIQIPDARIVYELPCEEGQDASQGSRTGHEDIEILTAAYHAGHLRSKALAGFRNYASASDRATITAKIEDEHGLMEDILDL